jgi:hypothetical protein
MRCDDVAGRQHPTVDLKRCAATADTSLPVDALLSFTPFTPCCSAAN